MAASDAGIERAANRSADSHEEQFEKISERLEIEQMKHEVAIWRNLRNGNLGMC